ncbi:MAG: HAD hydrolase family protein, partial [Candidatus Eisenbacteria bacterium]
PRRADRGAGDDARHDAGGDVPVNDARPDPSRVRLIALDSDGTLTERGIFWDDQGVGSRRFDVRDGLAMTWAVQVGIPVVVISGKSVPALDARLADLGVPGFQGVLDKPACLAGFAAEHGMTLADCAFLGDDLPDVPVMRQVGYSMAVADAHPLVHAVAAWRAPSAGGYGAAREAIEHLLVATGRWDLVLARYDARGLALPAAAGPFE